MTTQPLQISPPLSSPAASFPPYYKPLVLVVVILCNHFFGGETPTQQNTQKSSNHKRIHVFMGGSPKKKTTNCDVYYTKIGKLRVSRKPSIFNYFQCRKKIPKEFHSWESDSSSFYIVSLIYIYWNFIKMWSKEYGVILSFHSGDI